MRSIDGRRHGLRPINQWANGRARTVFAEDDYALNENLLSEDPDAFASPTWLVFVERAAVCLMSRISFAIDEYDGNFVQPRETGTMRKKHLTLAAVAVAASVGLAMSAGAASAGTYVWTATTAVGNGSGTFTTTGTGSPVTVTDITGLFNSSVITGLVSYAESDQKLNPNSTPPFDVGGISFTAGGVIYNFSNFAGGTPFSAAGYIANSVTDPVGQGDAQQPIYSFSLTSVPEPGAWALMLAGLGGVGGVARSRRRRVAIAA